MITHTPPFAVVNISGTPIPFTYRKKTSDEILIQSIFQHQEYYLPIQNFQPKLILDCGANIGCSAVYFANVYKNAQIYAVEPEDANFRLLQYNTFLYENIHPIHSALWDKTTLVRIEDKGLGEWGYMTEETTENDSEALKTITISQILAESGFNEIDLLKVDIEGAEKEVFGAPDVDDWLSKVKVIAIELHDRMKRGCSYEFFKAIAKYHWYFAQRGENLIFIRD